MSRDSINDEIRAIRHLLAAKFDNDLDRIVADLQRQQFESGRTYVTLPRRAPQSAEIPASQREELDRRLAEADANPAASKPWEEVQARLRGENSPVDSSASESPEAGAPG